jgi:transcriptional regulator
MYIPPHFNIADHSTAINFIHEYNFGMLVCNGAEIPEVTHLPFFVEENERAAFLITHLAKANPHWSAIEKQNSCLVIFNGPDGYVSPKLYSAQQNVPTWNYMTVHVAGKPEIITSDNEMRKLMHDTIAFTEKDFQQQYNTLAADYLDAMYKAIVFVRIEIISIETKFKLSQNKPEGDQRKVAEHFEKTGNRDLARWMKSINNL